MSDLREQRLTRDQLLQRLREVLAELQAGSRRGLHVMFGWDLEHPYRANWLLSFRDEYEVDVMSMPTFCAVDPISLAADAPQKSLATGIQLIETDELFVRMNIQITSELDESGERLGFVEMKWGQDWTFVGSRR